MEDKYPYKIFRGGVCLMEAPESCRYPKLVELSLLEAEYEIRLYGRKITKKELSWRGSSDKGRSGSRTARS